LYRGFGGAEWSTIIAALVAVAGACAIAGRHPQRRELGRLDN
jgi:hypothetical protein